MQLVITISDNTVFLRPSFSLSPHFPQVSRIEDMFHTDPGCVDRARPCEDEKIVEEAAKGASAERRNHWDLINISKPAWENWK